MKNSFYKLFTILLVIIISPNCFSQAGTLDQNFDPGSKVLGSITTISVDTNDMILIGGSFTSYDGVSINKIARLFDDGTIDTSFQVGTGFDNDVKKIHVQSDGKIMVGGSFDSYNGRTAGKLCRLNANGTMDTTFDVKGGAKNYYVDQIERKLDGSYVVDGAFTNWYRPGTAISYYLGSSEALCLDATGLLKSGTDRIAHSSSGYYSAYHVGGPYSYLFSFGKEGIRNITSPTAFPNQTLSSMGISDSTSTNVILVQDDGKIIVGWSHPSSKSNYHCLQKYNSDGTKDNVMKGVVNNNGHTGINSIIQDDYGNTYLGGNFSSYSSHSINNFCRLNATGAIDNTWAYNGGVFYATDGPNSTVNQIVVQKKGAAIIIGSFTKYDNIERKGIARIYTQLITEVEAKTKTEDGVFLGPNPSTGTFTVNSQHEVCNIKVYNSAGLLVKDMTNNICNTNGATFHLNKSGVYVVKIQLNSKSITKKVIVN
ncbi:MAG: putative delta-60 repeat protein [Glaciecola sp.]